MQHSYLSARKFWEDSAHFSAGKWEGELPFLDGIGSSVLFQTSGTTGTSKWIVIEKRSLLLSAQAVNDWLGVKEQSVWGLALPEDHVGGFAIFARVFKAGCGLKKLPQKWHAERFVEWVADEQVTHVSLVPTQLHDLVAASLRAPDCLAAAVIGGGRLLNELGQAARDLGWPVLASYGMTETCSQVATQRMESLGKPFSEGAMQALPIWKLSMNDDDLLSISGDALFCGTLIVDGEKAQFQPRASGPFLSSDRVILEGDSVRPLGRADSLVKVLGVLVDLEMIEDRLSEIGTDRISAGTFVVTALPEERREHILVAVFEGQVNEEILSEYNQQAGGIEKIDKGFSVPEFPRSSIGKIQRKRLAEIIAEM